MKKFRIAQCPHCGKKTGIIRAWVLKTQGEYKCPHCGRYSNIELDSAIYLLAVFAAVLSAIFFVIHFLLIQLFSWLSLCLVVAPFLIFFLLSPFLVRLRKPQVRKRPPAGQQTPHAAEPSGAVKITDENNMEKTIVMDYFKNL